MNAPRRGGKARPTRRVALAHPPPAVPGAGAAGGPNPARRAPRNTAARKRRVAAARPSRCREGGGRRRRRRQPYTVRLSATDISALASMKNVAKCDTWCELQNPANHRVFERKLRPRPPGRGHACLGVTPSDAPLLRGHGRLPGRRMRTLAPRAPRGRGGPKSRPPAGPDTADGGRARDPAAVPSDPGPEGPSPPPPRAASRPPARAAPLGSRPQVRRGHPPSLSISISGGEETYEDSPSNGERTGTSPA